MLEAYPLTLLSFDDLSLKIAQDEQIEQIYLLLKLPGLMLLRSYKNVVPLQTVYRKFGGSELQAGVLHQW